MPHFLPIVLAGVIAGAMNALAGGGSFVSLPALIAAGLPSVQANASSTVALFPGGLASVWAYRDGVSGIGPVGVRPLLLITLAGGALGAVLLLATSSSTFDVILPWLLLVACIALTFGGKIGQWMRNRWQIGPRLLGSIQFVLGLYGGYFGGAVGIMMLAVWSLIDGRDLKRLNPSRTVMTSGANAIAVVLFIAAHAIRWPETVALLAGATVGGYSGALIGRRAPVAVIRATTILLTLGTTIAFFWRSYAH